jgi:hypothetical protein
MAQPESKETNEKQETEQLEGKQVNNKQETKQPSSQPLPLSQPSDLDSKKTSGSNPDSEKAQSSTMN